MHKFMNYFRVSVAFIMGPILAIFFVSNLWANNACFSFVSSMEEVRELPFKSFYGRSFSREKKIALTFDDGPNQETLRILEILKRYDIKATFFFLGNQIEQFPDITRRAKQEGHAVGMHGFEHIKMCELNDEDFIETIQKTQKVFLEILRDKPDYFRPPFGMITKDQIKFLFKKGIKTIVWSVQSDDYRPETTMGEIVNNVREKAYPGAVVLLHNNEKTISALPQIIQILKKEGYSFYKIPDLFNEPNYIAIP